MLEDTDGDGKADRFTVFAEGLNIPSGIAVGHGGVWVANSPDILFLQDTDGDGKADTREVVVTGFGRDDTHELPNSLTWGPDGWLYGWNGVFNPSQVDVEERQDVRVHLRDLPDSSQDARLRGLVRGDEQPLGHRLRPRGLVLRERLRDRPPLAPGRDRLLHPPGRAYPPFTWPIESIVEHKHQKAAYCGIHYFDSAAYPPEYRGRLYMGNIHGNCINVDVLERNGSTYAAKPRPTSCGPTTPGSCRSSQKTGPDGCLYILDWYDRYHCYQDANRDPAGIDRLKGRLYRVRYKETPRRAGFDLAKSSDDELIELLGSPNVYDRDIAQRLLTERGSPAIRGKLEALVLDEKAPRTARMHGLWALSRQRAARAGLSCQAAVARATRPSAPGACGRRGTWARSTPAIRDQVVELARDPSPDVRLQVAIAARKIEGVDPLAVLLDVQQRQRSTIR